MSDPKPKDPQHDLDFFAGLQPSEPGGPVRAGTTVLPIDNAVVEQMLADNKIDAWPVHDDLEDDKVFTRYSHDLYATFLALQALAVTLREQGAHIHKSLETVFSGSLEILVPPADRPYISGTTTVVMRGRVLVKDEDWEENNDATGIVLLDDDPADVSDSIVINYAVRL